MLISEGSWGLFFFVFSKWSQSDFGSTLTIGRTLVCLQLEGLCQIEEIRYLGQSGASATPAINYTLRKITGEKVKRRPMSVQGYRNHPSCVCVVFCCFLFLNFEFLNTELIWKLVVYVTTAHLCWKQSIKLEAHKMSDSQKVPL